MTNGTTSVDEPILSATADLAPEPELAHESAPDQESVTGAESGPAAGPDRASEDDLSRVPAPDPSDRVPEPGEIDLRSNGEAERHDDDALERSDPDYHSILAAPPPPPRISDPVNPTTTETQVTLGSLAFRLFDTIENQIARDPHGATISTLDSRIEVLERSVSATSGHADALTGLGERLDEIDRLMAAPDPRDTVLTELSDRLAAVEHRLSAPHPHTGTIKSIVERLDDVEAKGTPRNISALTERLDIVERHTPGPQVISQMIDRLVAMERRVTAPEVITDLQNRFHQMDSRLTTLESPSADGRGIGRRVLSLIVFLVVVIGAVATGLVLLA